MNDEDRRRAKVKSIYDAYSGGSQQFNAVDIYILLTEIERPNSCIHDLSPSLNRKGLELIDARAEVKRLQSELDRSRSLSAAWKEKAKSYRYRANNLQRELTIQLGDMRELQVRLSETPEELQEVAESAFLAGMSGTWYDRCQKLQKEIELLSLELASKAEPS